MTLLTPLDPAADDAGDTPLLTSLHPAADPATDDAADDAADPAADDAADDGIADDTADDAADDASDDTAEDAATVQHACWSHHTLSIRMLVKPFTQHTHSGTSIRKSHPNLPHLLNKIILTWVSYISMESEKNIRVPYQIDVEK